MLRKTLSQKRHMLVGRQKMFPRDLNKIREMLNSVGWFTPPYVASGLLDTVASGIEASSGKFTQDDLESWLAGVYGPARMASMVANKYPQTPTIDLFSETISESVSAHFLGLHHVAVGGLIPVIEGAGRTLATERGL